jgi:hypothetical protein
MKHLRKNRKNQNGSVCFETANRSVLCYTGAWKQLDCFVVAHFVRLHRIGMILICNSCFGYCIIETCACNS